MDKNLLKEFIIEEYEKDFVVYACLLYTSDAADE